MLEEKKKKAWLLYSGSFLMSLGQMFVCVWKSSIKLHVEKTVRESFAWNFAYKATYPIRLCWMLGTSLKTKPEHISCSNQHTMHMGIVIIIIIIIIGNYK